VAKSRIFEIFAGFDFGKETKTASAEKFRRMLFFIENYSSNNP
jgi:hypothetical protein